MYPPFFRKDRCPNQVSWSTKVLRASAVGSEAKDRIFRTAPGHPYPFTILMPFAGGQISMGRQGIEPPTGTNGETGEKQALQRRNVRPTTKCGDVLWPSFIRHFRPRRRP